jgi:hypothetical protein
MCEIRISYRHCFGWIYPHFVDDITCVHRWRSMETSSAWPLYSIVFWCFSIYSWKPDTIRYFRLEIPRERHTWCYRYRTPWGTILVQFYRYYSSSCSGLGREFSWNCCLYFWRVSLDAKQDQDGRLPHIIRVPPSAGCTGKTQIVARKHLLGLQESFVWCLMRLFPCKWHTGGDFNIVGWAALLAFSKVLGAVI